MELNSLDATQLKKVILDASSALHRRQKVQKAMSEIQRVSKKYRLSKEELKLVFISLQSSKAVSLGKPKSVRAKVEPKYQSEDGAKTWTGRGRTPAWVVEICRSKGLAIEAFKKDPRFLIKSALPSPTAHDEA
jgi:DNA-binding protein H-NS